MHVAFAFLLSVVINLANASPLPPSPSLGPLSHSFLVNSSALPLITFPLPPSYAGLLPISTSPNEQNKLFFWYWPSTTSEGSQRLTIWLNGGPGCSSLTGFLMENGPISWKSGSAPEINPYGWTSASDMVWIDQPVGTGYSVGPSAGQLTTMPELAEQFYGFLQNFYLTFPTLLSKPLTLAGESYAGKYIPYIAQRILSPPSTLPIRLSGLLLSDGTYTTIPPYLAEQVPAAQFARKYAGVLGLNESVVQGLEAVSEQCGFEEVMDALLQYPPKEGVQLPADAASPECDTWDAMLSASPNPCLSPYNIGDTCPLGADNTALYFSRPDVQAALHAPALGSDFQECVPDAAFNTPSGYDLSPASSSLLPTLLPFLPHGITIQHGALDGLLLSSGDLLVLQNLTWGEPPLKGFREVPSGVLGSVEGEEGGVWGSERGITWVELTGAGHLVPYDQPVTALHIFRYVLGLDEL